MVLQRVLKRSKRTQGLALTLLERDHRPLWHQSTLFPDSTESLRPMRHAPTHVGSILRDVVTISNQQLGLTLPFNVSAESNISPWQKAPKKDRPARCQHVWRWSDFLGMRGSPRVEAHVTCCCLIRHSGCLKGFSPGLAAIFYN